MASKAQTAAQARYDAAHTKQITLKLNLVSDADILAKLNEAGNKQGYIKRRIRENNWIPITDREPDTAEHVLVTLKWDDDDYEVCELDYWIDKHSGGRFADKVIAWMPMPEAYKGRE